MEAKFSHQTLAKLSGLTRDKIDDFAATWPQLPVDERRRIVRALAEMAVDNVELDYNDLFLRMLGDEDAVVRGAAVEGLWEDDRPSTADRLIELARSEGDEEVRATAFDGIGRFALRISLGELGDAVAARVRQVLAEHVGAGTPAPLRSRAIEAAGYLDEPPFTGAVETAYASADPRLRAAAIKAMGRNCDDRWLPTILREMESETPELRFESVRAAAEMEDERAVPLVIERLEDDDPQIRLAAVGALGSIGGQRARRALQQVRAKGDDDAMVEAAETALDELEIATDPLGVRVKEVHKN
jgi:HEAT repeat protein